jgi:hypothetical protein
MSSVEAVPSTSQSGGVQEPSLSSCVICMDATAIMIILPCWHMCMCEECAQAQEYMNDNDRRVCPMCRGSIVEIKKPFIN